MTSTLPEAPPETVLRLVRVQRGIKLRDLAAATNTDKADLSRIERRIQRPTDAQRRRLADALDLSPGEVTERP